MPLLPPIQAPLIAKQPVERSIPFEAVEVAEPVREKEDKETPPEKVEVEVLETVRFFRVVVPMEA